MTHLIFGASAGVGRALAEQFAASGPDLILVSSDERALGAMPADLVIRYGVNVVFVAAELADGDGYLDRITEAANEMGGIGGMLFPRGALSFLVECTVDL